MSSHVREKLCEAMLALFEEDSVQIRLSKYRQYLTDLKHYEREIPAGLFNELKGILDDFDDFFTVNGLEKKLSVKQEEEFTERLLSIYIEVKGGGLIF